MSGTGYTVVRAMPGDADGISQLINSLAGYFTLNPRGLGAEAFLQTITPAAIQQLIVAPNMAYFMALRGTQLAGVIGLRDNAHLYHLFVAATFQGQGVGRMLWEHLLANETKGPFTVNATPHAVPVYERFGFVATGPRVESNGIAFVPMRRDGATAH